MGILKSDNKDISGNIEDFIIPEYDTEDYWKHFWQNLKNINCTRPPKLKIKEL